MAESSASYIHMVQHLIEKCIVFNMSMEECMEALSKHANIKPVITSTVWKELEKENKDFFDAYAKSRNRNQNGVVWSSSQLHKTFMQLSPSESSSSSYSPSPSYEGDTDD
ncbi:hypothetical protein Droror1_Dr00026116 [Drosera rotundifolia]